MLTSFLKWLARWFGFRTEAERWKAIYSEDEPDQVSFGHVFVVGEQGHHWQAIMQCPCRCGARIQLCLLQGVRPSWRVHVASNQCVTLRSSIWRTTGCRSHFFVRNGEIEWCRTEQGQVDDA